jgi:hypothetical protein
MPQTVVFPKSSLTFIVQKIECDMNEIYVEITIQEKFLRTHKWTPLLPTLVLFSFKARKDKQRSLVEPV